MQTERTFLDDLKYQYRYGGMTIRLLMLNAFIFLLIQILLVFAELIRGDVGAFLYNGTHSIFSLQSKLSEFIFQPWGLFTSIFSHFTFLHFLFNMLFLYSAGKMFEEIFDGRRLFHTYLLGGVFGGMLELLAHALFPALQGSSTVIVGASGSIMAIFTALAFYRPNLTVALFGVLNVRLIILAGLFIIYDIISLSIPDGTAHFAHLGGAILGMWSINGIYRSNNIIALSQKAGEYLQRFFTGLFTRSSRMKVKKGGKNVQYKTDEQYNVDAKQRQAKTDAILDKISKSGYESLTKAEKEFLFQQSKK
ncbi:MAG: rhomboid family intramembrane serine protease [Bacteroidota bacterium]|jgi:membrane associated rhomboid family serine protease